MKLDPMKLECCSGQREQGSWADVGWAAELFHAAALEGSGIAPLGSHADRRYDRALLRPGGHGWLLLKALLWGLTLAGLAVRRQPVAGVALAAGCSSVVVALVHAAPVPVGAGVPHCRSKQRQA